MNPQVMELGPLRIEGHTWGERVTYYNLRASLVLPKVSLSVQFATAPSGIFLNTSLSGKALLKILNS